MRQDTFVSLFFFLEINPVFLGALLGTLPALRKTVNGKRKTGQLMRGHDGQVKQAQMDSSRSLPAVKDRGRDPRGCQSRG